MNREIKFRGKRVDNGEWVYGHYAWDQIHVQPSYIGEWWGYEVIPETVSQFTGLTDKNGKEIYEGDKIKWWSGTYSIEGLPDNVKKKADQTIREWIKKRDGDYDYESNGWYKQNNQGIVVFYGASFCIHNESDITNHIKNSPYNLTSYYGPLQTSKEYEITGNIHDND